VKPLLSTPRLWGRGVYGVKLNKQPQKGRIDRSMNMYGYYRSGKKVNGVRSILVMHLIDEDGKSPMCGVPKELTLSEITLGKKICRGCMLIDKRQKKEIAKQERRVRMIEYTASMF
jgi:hypothetical protein